MAARWPSPQDYNEAVQSPQICFADPELKVCTAAVGKLGLPTPISGSFASVYRMESKETSWAVRCFLRPANDQQNRYRAISQYLSEKALSYSADFEYLEQGINVNGVWHPILKMEWVEGQTLDAYVYENLNNSSKLSNLCLQFLEMVAVLQDAGISHCDLQHGNIIVSKHQLRLVDYDGMFVPSMKNLVSNELGHRNYQHPGRCAPDFGLFTDNFSAWVIFTSLKALALDATTFSRDFSAGSDRLLFSADDFRNPRHSAIFAKLENHPSPTLTKLARIVRYQLKRPIPEIPPLCSEPNEPPPLEPLARAGYSSATNEDSREWWKDNQQIDESQSFKRPKEAMAVVLEQPQYSSLQKQRLIQAQAGQSQTSIQQPQTTAPQLVPIGPQTPIMPPNLSTAQQQIWLQKQQQLAQSNSQSAQATTIIPKKQIPAGITVEPELQGTVPRTVFMSQAGARIFNSIEMKLLHLVLIGILLALPSFLPLEFKVFVWMAIILLETVIWRRTYRDYDLARNGIPTIGVITRKTGNPNAATTNLAIEYEFDGQTQVTTVTESEFNALNEGQYVTVLKDHTHANRSCIYAICTFQAAKQTPMP